MKLILFILFAATLVRAEAPRDFAGEWSASAARYHDVSGRSSPCAKASIAIEQSPGRVVIKKYEAKCGLFETDWGPSAMTIKGRQVFNSDGDEIGVYENGELVTLERQGSVAFEFSLRRKGDALEAVYGARNFVGRTFVDGSFALKPHP